jgi:hypothetical protein
MIRALLARIAGRLLSSFRRKPVMTVRQRALLMAQDMGRDDLVERLRSL